MEVALAAFQRLPDHATLSKPAARKLRTSFDAYVGKFAALRGRIDPVMDPESSFEPGNPDTVGRLVVIALLAQDRIPLSEIRPTYGSGVYALYYVGDHPAYAEIAHTETPIYVGKADPDEPRAATPREQGVRLFGRLADHRDAIREVEVFGHENGLAEPLKVADFECRRLVCATNAQLVAERRLIDIFRPAWNAETKICFGLSKHGDNAQIRRNKKSPWDVIHPGRGWAAESPVRDGMTSETITAKLATHFVEHVPRRDTEEIMQILLDTFRQIGSAPSEISEAAADSEEVEKSNAKDFRRQGDLDLEDGEEA